MPVPSEEAPRPLIPDNPQAPDDLTRIQQAAQVPRNDVDTGFLPSSTYHLLVDDGIPFNADSELSLPPPPSSSSLTLPSTDEYLDEVV